MKGILPNFIVIGAMKCGTTSLCDVLARHPDVYFSAVKEPNFFAKDELYSKGIPWYQDLFASSNAQKAIGEGSTAYTMNLHFPLAPERIAKHLPNCRLIYIVRHPLKRMASHYRHYYNYQGYGMGSYGPESFAKYVKGLKEAIEISLYWKQLNYYRDLFPDDRIHIAYLEDFNKDPLSVVRDCLQFLGISTDSLHAIAPQLELERSRNAAKDVRLVPPLFARYRRSSMFGVLRNMLPETIMARLRRKFQFTLPDIELWTPELRRWAIEQIRDDNLAFLRHSGKPENFWNFEEVPAHHEMPRA
jgi:hypothetical protein